MDLDYQHPALVAAEFGTFVRGASPPGGSGDNDEGTGDL